MHQHIKFLLKNLLYKLDIHFQMYMFYIYQHIPNIFEFLYLDNINLDMSVNI